MLYVKNADKLMMLPKNKNQLTLSLSTSDIISLIVAIVASSPMLYSLKAVSSSSTVIYLHGRTLVINSTTQSSPVPNRRGYVWDMPHSVQDKTEDKVCSTLLYNSENKMRISPTIILVKVLEGFVKIFKSF